MFKKSLWLAALLAVGGLGCAKSGGSADPEKLAKLEKRVEKLESAQDEIDEMREFLRPIMAQQKAQAQKKRRSEPDPTARFAIPVEGNAYQGPEDALVTVVEAFDFA